MLLKRGLKPLKERKEYHNVFCFPIIQYYRNVGFDFSIEPFEDLAKEYIFLYHSNKSGNCKLHSDVEMTLKTINNMGITQIILSASEINNLLSQIKEFNITGYFDEMIGLSDIYAKSKIDVGLEYLTRKKVNKAILIGDTTHDYEVANALGVDCLLIPNGHQSKDTLLSCNVPVLDNISQVYKYLSGY
jgi:phosphoglycolate phosphatase